MIKVFFGIETNIKVTFRSPENVHVNDTPNKTYMAK